MNDKQEDKLRLAHILAAIEDITGYVRGVTREQFLNSSLIFNACARQLAVIGEACNKLTKETRAGHPEIPWREIITMRNIIIHDYFGVSLHFLWSTIEEDLPALKTQIQTILQKFD